MEGLEKSGDKVKRKEEQEVYNNTLGEVCSLINGRFQQHYPFVVYSNSALQLYDNNESQLGASPDIDMFSSREGIIKLEELLKDEEVSERLGVKNLKVYSGDEVFPDPGIIEPLLNLRCEITFSGKRFELDVWSGIGEGVIKVENDLSKGNLIGDVVYPRDVVNLSLFYNNIEREKAQTTVAVFSPDSVGRIYDFIEGKERLMVEKAVLIKGKNREPNIRHASELRSIDLSQD